MNHQNLIILGAIAIPGLIAAIVLLHQLFTVQVEEFQTVILISFGKWTQQWDQPGEYWAPKKILPWVKTIDISRQVRSITLDPISIHDSNGTSLLTAIFMEYTIVDPKKLIFSVEDWKASMKSLCLHATTSVLSGLQFEEILKNRSVLEQKIRAEIQNDMERWGVELRHFLIQNLSLLPEVNRQILQGVAAHLEKKKALIEEFARMEALKIDANTQHEIAHLKGEAQSQMALAIGRAIESMRKSPAVFDAYQKLYNLSLSKPEQTVIFDGFDEKLTATDASFMLASNSPQTSSQKPMPN